MLIFWSVYIVLDAEEAVYGQAGSSRRAGDHITSGDWSIWVLYNCAILSEIACVPILVSPIIGRFRRAQLGRISTTIGRRCA